MKKNQYTRTGHLLNTLFNFRLWFDWERTRIFTQYVWSSIKRVFVPDPSGATESFEEASARLHLNEEALALQQRSLLRLSRIMLLLTVGILTYTFYQLFYGSYRATLVSLVVVLISLVMTFRYHFWYFQIKTRKLGCSFQEWFKQGLLGEKK